MSSGIGASGQMSLSDFMRLYAPTALPQAAPAQSSALSALGQYQTQPIDPRSMGFSQGQQGGSLPFLGQLGQLGASPAAGASGASGGQAASRQPQSGQGGLQQLLMNAMSNNGANGSSNRLADAVGYVPFGTGSFG